MSDKLEDLPLENQNMIKTKYLKTLLAQYKVGQIIPYFDWPGAQIFYNGRADFARYANKDMAIISVCMGKPFAEVFLNIPLLWISSQALVVFLGCSWDSALLRLEKEEGF